ncbi:hypothetical protein Cni_G13907 [Canna indica]|uniref:Uncharacterized protein n=1 Tax=Canna indica TaxID=4628 RepID=A0AAQ3QA76_9LILI|nr:hypothetical protein Cni_G13907 [Canna indica]
MRPRFIHVLDEHFHGCIACMGTKFSSTMRGLGGIVTPVVQRPPSTCLLLCLRGVLNEDRAFCGWLEIKFFLDGDDGSWFSWSAEDVLEADGLGEEHEDEDEQDDEIFESWKSMAEAIIELHGAQEDERNEEGLACEDWLGGDGLAGGDSSSWGQDSGREEEQLNEVNDDPEEIMREKGILGAIKDSIVGDEDLLLFEDRVF